MYICASSKFLQAQFTILNDTFDHIYVLSLKRATERQAAFNKAFEGLHYSFFFGADKQDFDIAQLIETGVYDEQKAKHYHRYSKAMSAGQIGCAWSHVLIYEDMLKNGYQKVLILEDDTEPIKASFHHLNQILQELPTDWELIFFDYFKNEKPDPINQAFYHFTSAIGLLKWSHKMIRNFYPKPISKHISTAGFHHFTNAYALTASAAEKLIPLQKPIAFIADHLLPHAITNQIIKGYISIPKIFMQISTGNNKVIKSYVDEG